MTAELSDRDDFMMTIGEAVSAFERQGATPHQVNTFLDANRVQDPEEPTLFGIPISEIRGVTLDGRYWLEVYGKSLTRETLPGAIPVYTFRVAQAPGGKAAKYGIEQGAVVVTTEARIQGVTMAAPHVRVRQVGD